MKALNKPTDERMALIRSQATSLLWNGKLETTYARAKNVRSFAEKIITLAVNTYTDSVKVVKTSVDAKGNKVNREVINDGPKKLAARRAIMSKLYTVKEQRAEKESKTDFVNRTKDIKHPLIEKLFNEIAPKYAQRKETLGTGGGYTRIIKLGTRNGDCAEMAIIELI